jgi:hypothetical protein
MTGQRQETERLRGYLLGTLPEDERDRLEVELLRDDALYEELLALEDEAVHDLATGDDLAGELGPIASRLRSTAEGRRRLAAARTLVEGLATGPPARRWLETLAAAAVLLIVVGVVWMVAMRKEPSHPQHAQAPLTGVPAATPMPTVQPPLANASPAPQIAPTPVGGSTDPLAGLVTLALAPGLVRGEAAPARVTVGASTATVRLRLALPAGADVRAPLRAVLRDADGAEVWTRGGLRPASGLLLVDIASSALPEGDYELVLAAGRGGQTQEVAEYSFGVLRNP